MERILSITLQSNFRRKRIVADLHQNPDKFQSKCDFETLCTQETILPNVAYVGGGWRNGLLVTIERNVQSI